jgi:hypothetical protein
MQFTTSKIFGVKSFEKLNRAVSRKKPDKKGRKKPQKAQSQKKVRKAARKALVKLLMRAPFFLSTSICVNPGCELARSFAIGKL